MLPSPPPVDGAGAGAEGAGVGFEDASGAEPEEELPEDVDSDTTFVWDGSGFATVTGFDELELLTKLIDLVGPDFAAGGAGAVFGSFAASGLLSLAGAGAADSLYRTVR